MYLLEIFSGLSEENSFDKDIYSQAKAAKTHLEMYKLFNEIERKKNKGSLGIDIQTSILEKENLIVQLVQNSNKDYISITDKNFYECIQLDNFKKWPNISQSFWSCSNQYTYLIESDLLSLIDSIETEKTNRFRDFWIKSLLASITVLVATYILNDLDFQIFHKITNADRFEKIDRKDIREFISNDELEYLRSSLGSVFSDLDTPANLETNEKPKPTYSDSNFYYIDIPPSNILYKRPSKDFAFD